MYTVVRFGADAATRLALDGFVATVNAAEGAGFLTARARGDGYAAALSDGDEWPSHVDAIARFVAAYGDAINGLVRAGVHAAIDTAIEPDDVPRSAPYVDLHFSPQLLASLATCGVYAGFTLYSGPLANDQ
jgi:hypothetical protein